MRIGIRKLNVNDIVFAFLVYCGIALVATYMFRLPKVITYSIDVFNIVLFLYCLYHKNFKISKYRNRSLKVIFVCLLISISVGYFLNVQSVALLLWGARNNYRGVLFMFTCISLMKVRQKEEAICFFEKIFWIHVVLVLYQYFVLGNTGDYIGGIFGIAQGGNSGNNLILCIASTIALWRYLRKECNLTNLLIKLGCCFAVAAVSELKFYFAEIFIIVGLLLSLSDGVSRKVKAIAALICALIVGLSLLYTIFPQWIGYFTIEHFMELLDGGRNLGGRTIDRFSSLPELYRIFYSGKGSKILFGYGLGSADYSLAYEFLKSPIYLNYYFTGYSQLSYAFLFIELGIIGSILYLLLIIAPIISGLKRKDEYCPITVVVGVLCLLLIFYDVTMKIEPQYFAFFLLSMPFWNEEDCENNLRNKVRIE